MSRSVIIIVALFVLAVAVRAIPESELNYNDPHLIEKIVNGSIVVDVPESRKRQSGVIASFYMSANLGSKMNDDLTATTTQRTGGDFVNVSPYGVSSVQLFDQNYLLVLYGAANYAGSYVVIRTLQPINDLANYAFNDATLSVKIIYMGAITHSVTLFEDGNLSGRSAYITAGSYSDITTAGYSGTSFNQVRNDKVSSAEVYPDTVLRLYSDGGFSGTLSPALPSGSGSSTTTVYNSMSAASFCNDCASSVTVAAV